MYQNKMAPSLKDEQKYLYGEYKKLPANKLNQNHPSVPSQFARQDSLAIASALQEQDRGRTMSDFMETQLDLDTYLDCFNELHVPPDTVDFDDMELQKAHILYDDNTPFPENNAFPQENQYNRDRSFLADMEYAEFYHPDMSTLSHQQRQITNHVAVAKKMPEPIHRSPVSMSPNSIDEERYEMQCEKKEKQKVIPEPKKSTRKIKKPIQYEEEFANQDAWDDSSSNSSSDECYASSKKTNNRKRKNSDDSINSFRPQTKARKYNLKPDTEKVKPVYQLKRARNNDAVRKSRSKAKELQKKKDDEYDKMKKRINELEGLLEAEKKARKRDREMIEQLIQR